MLMKGIRVMIGSKGPEQASFVNSEQNPAKYLSTVAPYVATGVADMMHDNPDDGEAAKDEDNSDVLTLLPAAVDPAPEAKTKVWAYNVLPGATPHIVVRFSKVVVKDSYEQPSDPGEPEVLTTLTGPDKPLFITVRGFLNGESEKITSFAVNNVYTLGDIAFDRSDLSEIPEDESLNVVVNVEMLKWKDNPITWDKD